MHLPTSDRLLEVWLKVIITPWWTKEFSESCTQLLVYHHCPQFSPRGDAGGAYRPQRTLALTPEKGESQIPLLFQATLLAALIVIVVVVFVLVIVLVHWDPPPPKHDFLTWAWQHGIGAEKRCCRSSGVGQTQKTQMSGICPELQLRWIMFWPCLFCGWILRFFPSCLMVSSAGVFLTL